MRALFVEREWVDDNDVDWYVCFRVEADGKFIPASLYSPAEQPIVELSIDKLVQGAGTRRPKTIEVPDNADPADYLPIEVLEAAEEDALDLLENELEESRSYVRGGLYCYQEDC